MQAVDHSTSRDLCGPRAELDAVAAALDTVMDPELDESVAAMGFIESVRVEAGRADIVFRLPTFWCSANFAFLMAADMRLAVEQVPGIETARVRLVDHFAAGKINRGVADGAAFSSVFSGEAKTDLAELRRNFQERAFLGRQESVLRAMAAERGAAAALATTMEELQAFAQHGGDEIRGAAIRYLTLRRHEKGGSDPKAPAFITVDGAPIEAADYPAHLRTLRRVKGAAESNAEMCRLYIQARRSNPAPGYEAERQRDDTDE
ncbi:MULTISPECIES: metal-sulfur cluster assembly factor [unclassified Rhizobium]|uniref:metal-sulfur cluster assembly factor n=1 Tax=unclassified Rhizobium TaxID=2613769 RepID=UPI0007EB2818|nr:MULTISPECIES: iron-sulfur cluster assembly protein [unclassified Rhizobium]ANM14433.1 hypothetical protein AMK05_PE00059 [Rhizobium sp. N324]ANM20818.1 hypothetical protein AMK06_PE00058 [Rhizobium sp. N541]ANM27201.1 hypothetical protein AMK07_PE00058 [Rhizobium sp. N941]OYC99532.1 hypothetical protein AMK08_PE00059 [Rhizobium sp. N4311]